MNRQSTAIRSLLIAMLNGPGSDDGWSLLSQRLRSLDYLSPFERALLPLAYDRWRRSGRKVDDMAVVKGIYRNTFVRNRLFLVESQRILASLRGSGIDVIVFKSGGLLSRLLPELGIRAIADIDLWVRPSQITKALKVLGIKGEGPRLPDHALNIEMVGGLQLDIHALPSHIFADRYTTAAVGEALFESTWSRSTGGDLSDSDLLYFSFLNALYSHPPGESRSAFALLELHMALRNDTVTDDVLAGIARRVREHRTAAVFLEHYNWLGSGQSASIDRFIEKAVIPAAGPRDVEVAHQLSRHILSTSGMSKHDLWLRTFARKSALAMGGGIYSGVLGRCYQAAWHDPGRLLSWLGRPGNLRRLWRVSFHMMTGIH